MLSLKHLLITLVIMFTILVWSKKELYTSEDNTEDDNENFSSQPQTKKAITGYCLENKKQKQVLANEHKNNCNFSTNELSNNVINKRSYCRYIDNMEIANKLEGRDC